MSQRVAYGVFDGEFCFPAKLCVGFGGVSPKSSKVASASASIFMRNGLARNTLECADKFRYRVWLSIP